MEIEGLSVIACLLYMLCLFCRTATENETGAQDQATESQICL